MNVDILVFVPGTYLSEPILWSLVCTFSICYLLRYWPEYSSFSQLWRGNTSPLIFCFTLTFFNKLLIFIWREGGRLKFWYTTMTVLWKGIFFSTNKQKTLFLLLFYRDNYGAYSSRGRGGGGTPTP